MDLACQAPLSMGFSRQEYWSGLLCSTPGDLPDPGIEPAAPILHADYLPLSHRHLEKPVWKLVLANWEGFLYATKLVISHDTALCCHQCRLHSVQFSHSVVFDSLRPHGLHAAHQASLSITNSWSLPISWSQWYHPTISSSVVPFSSHLQSFPASGSFPKSQFFASSGQSIGVSASASVLPVNIQDWFPLGLTVLISLQPKGLARVFSNTTVQKH